MNLLGQAPFNINVSGIHGSGFGPVFPLLAPSILYYLAQFAFAYRILTRGDFDTQNKILWLLVVVLVPLGFILYLVVAPAVPPPPAGSPGRIVPGSDISGTPWANNPGHTKRS